MSKPITTISVTTSAELSALCTALTQFIDNQDDCSEPTADERAQADAAQAMLDQLVQVYIDLGNRPEPNVREVHLTVTQSFDVIETTAAAAPQAPRVCSRCSSAPWQCGACGAMCCEHRCSGKLSDGLATCSRCKQHGKGWSRLTPPTSKPTLAMHRRGHRLASGACGAAASRSTVEPAKVTCKRCVFQMLLLSEIAPSDARVTDAMRRKGGYHAQRGA